MSNNNEYLAQLRKQHSFASDCVSFSLGDRNRRSLQVMLETLVRIHTIIVAAIDLAIESPSYDTHTIAHTIVQNYGIARCDHELDVAADSENWHTWTDKECDDLTARLRRVGSKHVSQVIWMSATQAG